MALSRYLNYKGVRVNAFGLPVLGVAQKTHHKKSVKKSRQYHISFFSPFKTDAPKNLIVMYDIPDSLKKERDWLRRHLIRFGYTMIQRSVWVGPSPLPKEFRGYLKEIKIGDKIKTLKLAKPHNSSISAIA